MAVVGDTPITRAQFAAERPSGVKAEESLIGSGVPSPDPPTYAKCIAAFRAQDARAKQPKRSTSVLRALCEQAPTRDQEITRFTMEHLLAKAWTQAAAKEQGVTVSEADARHQFDQVKKRFKSEQALRAALASAGQTEAEAFEDFRQQLLAAALARRAGVAPSGRAQPSQQQLQRVAAYQEAVTRRWTVRTVCRAGYVITMCSNAPKPRVQAGTGQVTTAR